MSSVVRALQGTPIDAVGDAIDVMKRIDEALPRDDGVSAFNRLYLAVTIAVDDRLRSSPHTWRDAEFIRRLDVVFANLYFSALRSSVTAQPIPRAWRALLEARARGGVAKIQFALAGMNAHINRDLVLAIADVCKELRRPPSHASDQYHDFTAINVLLEEVQERVKAEFAKDLVGEADRLLGTLDDVVAMWSVGVAREAAWCNAEVYSALPDLDIVEQTFINTLDRTTGFAGRGLLVPVGFP